MAKMVTQHGTEEDIFLGLAEPQLRGAVRLIDAMKEALRVSFGQKWSKIVTLASSIVTEGASVNTGDKNGLWTLLQELKADSSSNLGTSYYASPLLKVWCSAHRSQLAWQSVSTTVVEVKSCFQNLVSIVTYFHTSGLRTRELKTLAGELHSELCRLLTVFEVRWPEFHIHSSIQSLFHGLHLLSISKRLLI